MKEVLEKLARGENNFPCYFNGITNSCKILILNMETKKAFVRFDKPTEISGINKDISEPIERWIRVA